MGREEKVQDGSERKWCENQVRKKKETARKIAERHTYYVKSDNKGRERKDSDRERKHGHQQGKDTNKEEMVDDIDKERRMKDSGRDGRK